MRTRSPFREERSHTGNSFSHSDQLLVVEDELLVALDVCMMVEDLGYDVAGPAPTSESALALLEVERPGAALLDENLGGVSVAPLARELSRRHIPFGIVSGHGRSPSSEPLTPTG